MRKGKGGDGREGKRREGTPSKNPSYSVNER